MPRSKRAYGDPAPATLAKAIAFVHYAQTTKGLHLSTCAALSNRYEFAMSRPHYIFNEADIALGNTSPLGKACAWLVANGYKLRLMEKHGLRSGIQFWNAEASMYGVAEVWGDVFLYPETGRWAEVIDGERVEYTKRFKPA